MGCSSSTEAVDGLAPSGVAVDSNAVVDTITPAIGFVLKTKKSDDAKVFVNVFHFSSVLYIISTDPKIAADKGGGHCLTYDVAINTAVAMICGNSEDARFYVSFLY